MAGEFITRDEIERRRLPSTPELLRGVSAVQVLPRGPGRRGRIVMRPTGCVADVYLDGMRVSRRNPGGGARGRTAPGELHTEMFGTAPTRANEAYDALNLAVPVEVEMIEIHSGADPIPCEFGSSAGACGVIAVWTQRGGSG